MPPFRTVTAPPREKGGIRNAEQADSIGDPFPGRAGLARHSQYCAEKKPGSRPCRVSPMMFLQNEDMCCLFVMSAVDALTSGSHLRA